MKRFPSCLLLLPLLFHSVLIAEEEWTYLFEGATHGDFYYDFLEDADPEEVFEFTDDKGLLIKAKDNPEGYIQTLDEYSDYELAFEWRWPEEEGESGVLIHSSIDPAYSVWPESIEIQIKPEEVGDFWLLNRQLEVTDEQKPKKAAERDRRLKLKDKGKEKKKGEWNSMRILAEGDTVKVYLNDELVNEGTGASATSGYITLQAQGSDIEFREFRLRQLEE